MSVLKRGMPQNPKDPPLIPPTLRHISYDERRARHESPHTKSVLVQFHPGEAPSLMARPYCRAAPGSQ